MSYEPGPEARELGSIVRSFMEKHVSEESVRMWMEKESSFDPQVWTIAADELGLHGLAIPEEFGGSGAGLAEIGVVFEEAGRALYGGPLLASVGFAANALLSSRDDAAQRELLPGIAAGETIAAVGWSGRDPMSSRITATPDGVQFTLTGTADYVLAGPQADVLLCVATDGNGPGLYAIAEAKDLDWTVLSPMDQTRALGHVRLSGTPAVRIDMQPTDIQRAVDIWTLLLAAEQLGGIQRVLESAVDYASTRVQFGRRIGSFQAIKHRCADMLVDLESARSVVWHGLWTADNNPTDIGIAASLAGAVSTEAYLRAASENVQIHGGVGFTWEHHAHLYVKRAKASALLLPSPTTNRSRLGDLLGLAEGR